MNDRKKVVLIGSFRLSNAGLYHLMTCSSLQHLELTNSDMFLVDFDEGLAPVLAELGPRLLTLKLDRLRHLDISCIGRLCPALRSLSLAHIVHFTQLMNVSEVNIYIQTVEMINFITEPLFNVRRTCPGKSIWKLYCIEHH